MKIYTRTGDKGETSLFGGERVPKSHPRIEAYGTVDELNSCLGVVRAAWRESPMDEMLATIQAELFDVGAFLASPAGRFAAVGEESIASLESWIDDMDGGLPPLDSFVLPGGTLPAAQLHVARTVCRRAERLVISMGEESEGMLATVRYLNRLSDALFVAARRANQIAGVDDVKWKR